MFFAATQGGVGNELFYFNPVSEVLTLAANVDGAATSSSPQYITNAYGDLYFSATTAANGREVYKWSNGTTTRVSDINSGAGSSTPLEFKVVASDLVFFANDGTSGTELWKVDLANTPTIAPISAKNIDENLTLSFSAFINSAISTTANLTEHTDYKYYTDTRVRTHIEGADLAMGANNITTTGKMLYSNVYSAEGDLPSASTYHGMFAHVHGTGLAYYAHSGNWVKLAKHDDSIKSNANDTASGIITFSNTTASTSATTGAVVVTGGVGVGGSIYATGDVTAYSDESLKTNIKTIDNGLDKVMALRGITFDRIADGSTSTGVSAQDVAAVLPEAVATDDEGLMAVKYGNLVGLLIEAIKDLKEEVNDLKATGTMH